MQTPCSRSVLPACARMITEITRRQGFVDMLRTILEDNNAPLPLKRRALQIALLFMCGVNQMSPGAYILRCTDLLTICLALLRRSESASFSVECVLLLALLANYHKSDASALNAFLKGVKEAKDDAAFAQICVSVQVVCASTVRIYQDVSDDTPPSIVSAFSTMLSSLRPDKAFASTHVDIRDQFKHLPPAQTVVLFAAHEFMHESASFRAVLIVDTKSDNGTVAPCLHTLLSMSSYLFTHGSASPRSVAYASLALNILAVISNHDDILAALSSEPAKGSKDIWLCRQREPPLPLSSAARPALASLLDVCILFIRHNMQKRLEVQSYLTCISVLHRVLRYMYGQRMRFVYHWEELWKSLISLLDFMATKLDTNSVPRADELMQHVIILLRAALLASEAILPTPAAVHQFLYELVRSAHVLAKHKAALPYTSTRTSAAHKRGQTLVRTASRSMAELEKVIAHYSDKLAGKDTSGRTVETVMASIRSEVDRNGIFGLSADGSDAAADVEDLETESEDISATSFLTWACSDGFSLVPLQYSY
ncbi:hypothetical protein BKA62DRAFT_685856 [Auriculariales sp. MPI-PUGE-AT-0066]|nr:hypothetical protein BKA62DRAFT_685856 [Auriculariales sp. MPI-PUGE-AT-0066]